MAKFRYSLNNGTSWTYVNTDLPYNIASAANQLVINISLCLIKEYDMLDIKNWYTSKTMWGIIISLVASLLNNFHIIMNDAAQTAAVDMIVQVVQYGGLLLAGYGRIKANTIIK